ncbi:MAG: oligosaccharide flippase family protein, partial [Candidatus Paceibacterota bacterium]
GKKQFRKNTLLGFVRRIIPILVLLATIAVTDNVILIVFAYFASNTLTMLSVYFTAKREIESGPMDKKKAREMISNSKHFSLMNVAGTAAGQLDKILVFHFLGAAPLAVYAFATMPVIQLRKFSSVLRTLIIPKITTRSIPELKKSIPKKMLILTIVAVCVVLLYISFAPFLFELIFPKYIESVHLSQVFSLSLLVTPFIFISETFRAHMKKRELYITQTAVPITRIILLLILTPLYGIWGAVVAILLTLVVAALLSTYLFYRLQ